MIKKYEYEIFLDLPIIKKIFFIGTYLRHFSYVQDVSVLFQNDINLRVLLRRVNLFR